MAMSQAYISHGRCVWSRSRALKERNVGTSIPQLIRAGSHRVVKSFSTLLHAQKFVAGVDVDEPSRSKPTKYYAVRQGRVPGIYDDWPSAQSQVLEWPKPVYKSFPSREAAQAFLGQPLGSV